MKIAIDIDEVLEEIEAVEGAKDARSYLNCNFDLIFLTARPLKIKEKTIKFLEKNFEIKDPEVYFSSDGYIGENKTKTKVDFCKEFGVSYLIEDNSDFFKDGLENGLKVYLLDKPWNKEIEVGDGG